MITDHMLTEMETRARIAWWESEYTTMANNVIDLVAEVRNQREEIERLRAQVQLDGQ